MALDIEKLDRDVGDKIRQHLMDVGVETPMDPNTFPTGAISKVHAIQEHIKGIMSVLGLDLEDDSLMDTPKRVAKMYVNELFYGLDYTNFPKATVVGNKFKHSSMVLERNIIVNSVCEHHLAPIMGFAHVAYIPGDRVIGLSKLNRIVDFFARRPQIQERLTEQIWHTLSFLMGTENVAVCIDAEHLCVKTRGVQDACSDTVTSKLGGEFMNSGNVRSEFYSMIAVGKTK